MAFQVAALKDKMAEAFEAAAKEWLKKAAKRRNRGAVTA